MFLAIGIAACGADTADEASAVAPTDTPEAPVVTTAGSTGAGIRVVSPAEGADIQSGGPDDLIVLDVRTAEEFAEGHLEGAIMIDFYADDFADQLAELDPDASYLMYCRSGNRSGQTRVIMEQLGFTDVADVDGGIVAWADADLPLTTP